MTLSFSTATTGFGAAALDQAYFDFFGFERGSGKGEGTGFAPSTDDKITLRGTRQVTLRFDATLWENPKLRLSGGGAVLLGHSHFLLKDGFGLFVDPADLRFGFAGIEAAVLAERLWALPHGRVLAMGLGGGMGVYLVHTRLDSALLDVDSHLRTNLRFVEARARLEGRTASLWLRARGFADHALEVSVGMDLPLSPKR